MDVCNGKPEDPRQEIANTERRTQMRQQLVLLLHAYKCLRQFREEECTLRHCSTMKRILIHLETCRKSTTCTEPHCFSSREILKHWKNCQNKNCQLCLPLKVSKLKEWQHSFSEEQRHHLVDLLLQTVSIDMASRWETKSYASADSLEDFYRMIAAKKLDMEMESELASYALQNF